MSMSFTVREIERLEAVSQLLQQDVITCEDDRRRGHSLRLAGDPQRQRELRLQLERAYLSWRLLDARGDEAVLRVVNRTVVAAGRFSVVREKNPARQVRAS
jgi:hypothetical protein